MSLFDDLGEVCRRNVPLAPLTWFGLGGSAEYMIEPETEEQLAKVVRLCHENGTPLRCLGLGANVLVSEGGVSGVVVRLTGAAFTGARYDGTSVEAGAGLDLARLVRHTVRRGLGGLEVLAGIPGTVGGGVRMNCGGRYGEIGTVVTSIRVVDHDGQIHERHHDDLGFAYRHCDLGGEIVVAVTLGLSETVPDELVRHFRQIWMYKQNTQPRLAGRSAGCIFRNPGRQSAGALIDEAGLKGERIGGAHVSERHANFIIVERGGTAAEVLRLIALIQERVEAHCHVQLEPEVEIW